MNVQQRYERALSDNHLQPDAHQATAVAALNDLYGRVIKRRQKASWWKNLITPPQPVKGLYMYGPVGRGKSMLMQFFIDALQDHNTANPDAIQRTERHHFHAFMLELHRQLYQRKVAQSALNNQVTQVADKIADLLDVLCFDEFHVTDVADAMLLMPLFTRLWQRGVVVVATSNVVPHDLYKNGLQRQRFLPFIALLQERLQVLSVSGPDDYRQQQWHKSAALHDRWLAPLDTDTEHEFADLFAELVGYDPVQLRMVEIKDQGRAWEVPKASPYVAWLSADSVLQRDVGAADFIALTQQFKIIMLDGLEPFKADHNNRAKRFMVLIDTVYEAGTQLYVRAALEPQALYPQNGPLAFEFARTVSRLQELRYRKD